VADASTKLYTHAKPEDVATGVFSGPYSPSIWTAGSQLDYVPNAKFWETIRPGTAPFDSVTFKFYADPQTEIAGFQNDEIDVALEFNQNHLPLMSAIDPASIQKDLGVTWEHTSWNLARLTEQFGEAGAKAVIQALHYAIDKEEINQRIANGGVTPVCNNNVPGVWWYKEIPCVPYDVAKANEILDAAGFVTGTDGVRTLDGKPLEIQSCTRADRQYRIDTQRLLADQLTKIGVKLNLDHVATDVAVLFSSWEGADAAPADAPCNLTRGNFGVTEFAWVGTPDPTSGQFQYMSKYNPSLGDHTGQNYIRVNIPEVDKIFETATTTVDLTKIKPLMEEFQDIFVNVDNAFPEIPLYNWTTVLIRKPTMHNVVNNSSAATQTWNIEDWWRAAS
jgi:peptide/nickel transport system substrate-binding protein